MPKGAYAERGGVDYKQLQRFKDMMVEVARRTASFGLPTGGITKEIIPLAHGVWWRIKGEPYGFVETLEGLGNKDWVAEWMYLNDPKGGSRYNLIARDLLMMPANDNAAHGAQPFLLEDEVAAGTSEWFNDPLRSRDFAGGVFEVCKQEDMTLGGGESPAYKFLLRATPPVVDAPTMSAHVTGIVNPRSRLVTCIKIRPGDVMIGVPSSGIHSNGVSLVISVAMELPEQFMTKLPSGQTLGDAVLTPTLSYTRFVQAILDAGIRPHAFLPVTGDGVGKLAFDKRPLTYVVDKWLPDEQIPEIFRFIRGLPGIKMRDVLTTFNWGIGYVVYVAKNAVERTLKATTQAGFEPIVIGSVQEGKRGTRFMPYRNIWLDPPGE